MLKSCPGCSFLQHTFFEVTFPEHHQRAENESSLLTYVSPLPTVKGTILISSLFTTSHPFSPLVVLESVWWARFRVGWSFLSLRIRVLTSFLRSFASLPIGSSEFLAAGRCGWVPGSGRGGSASEYPFCGRSRAWVRTEGLIVFPALLLDSAFFFLLGRVFIPG